MKNLIFFAFIATFVSLFPMTISAQIVNGSFEDGNLVDSGWYYGYFAGDPGLTGWTVGGPGGIEVVDAGYWPASVGNHSIDLNGFGHFGSISQPVSTVPGVTYTVSFDMSGNPESTPEDAVKSMVVTADGGQAVTFSYDTAAAGNTSVGQAGANADMMYEAKAYTFVASGSTTVLAFTGLNDSGQGVVLDNISITNVTAAVCHRNYGASQAKTLIIGKPALAAHLAHGDSEGPCQAK